MMKEEPEYKKVEKSLKVSRLDGSFFSVMDGVTTPFISAYALFLGAPNIVISLLASVPELAASFFQLLAIKVNEIFQNRKKVLVISAFLQALVWIPILMIPRIATTGHQAHLLIIFYSMVIMISHFMNPIWRSMMGDLVPESQRGVYFGKRHRISASVTFVSTLIAGFTLQKFSSTNALTGFTILFCLAVFARLASSICLSMMFEKSTFNPTNHNYPQYKYTLKRFLKDLSKSDYGKFVLFVCAFKIAVNISSPFFIVYELKHLGFSYLQYTGLMSIEIISSVLFMGLWGKLNDEKGSKNVIIISGFLIPFIPLLYLFSTSYLYLALISAFSGGAWAGFNLAVGNFMFDASSPQERVRYSSYFNLFNGISIFIGAITGGFLLTHMPETTSSIYTVFVISFVGRLAVALLMFPKLKELRLVELSFGKSFFRYPLIVKPRQRFIQDPFDYYLAYPGKPKKSRPRLYIDESIIAEPKDNEKERKEQWKVKKFMERYGPNK